MFVDASSFSGLESGEHRYKRGIEDATNNINEYTDRMAPGETFKIISHSQGGAYAAGIAQVLINNGYQVENMLALAPHQTDAYMNPKQPITIQVSNKSDPVTNPFSTPSPAGYTDYFLLLSDSTPITQAHGGVVHETTINTLSDYLKKIGNKDIQIGKDGIMYHNFPK